MQPGVEGGGRLGQVAGDGRRVGDDAAVALVLAVEDAQRIALQPRQAVVRQLRLVLGEIRDQRVAVGLAAFLVAERVDLQHRSSPATPSACRMSQPQAITSASASGSAEPITSMSIWWNWR